MLAKEKCSYNNPESNPMLLMSYMTYKALLTINKAINFSLFIKYAF